MIARYSIVRGDPRAHKRDVLALAAGNLPTTERALKSRYRKYYETSPLGPPFFFLSRDAQSQRFVGIAALFPARLRVLGDVVPAGITGDFAVEAGHRGFGPAIALQRALLSALSEHKLTCAYGSPNPFAEPVIDRVGYADLGRLTRFVKVLNTRMMVETFFRGRRLTRLASMLSSGADPVLSVVSRERLHKRSILLSVERPAVFDDRFSDVWEATWRQHAITSERNADLLNWKYEKTSAAPSGTYSIFSLVTNRERVAGYIVYRVKDGVRHIFDIVFLSSRTVADTLLAEFIRDARSDGAAAISLLYLGPTNLLTRRLRAFGFFSLRPQPGLRVFVQGEMPRGVDLLNHENWYFLSGDEDV